jgi:hypothetical protein
MDMLSATQFNFGGNPLIGGARSLLVYRRTIACGEVVSIKRLYGPGESTLNSVDGWSNHATIDEARNAWKTTKDSWTKSGWVAA